MTRFNWDSQSTTYDGQITFPAVSDQWTGVSYPAVTIPLFIQQLGVPVRKQTMSEINTAPQVGRGGRTSHTMMTFYGTPEPLTLDFSGFLISPFKNNRYTLSAYGLTTFQDISTPELILMYLEGNMRITSYGTGVRVDPSQFIDPYGNVYNTPTIMTFESSFTVTPKKQNFSMQLWLEN